MPILSSETLALCARLVAEWIDGVIRPKFDKSFSGAASAQSLSIEYLMRGAFAFVADLIRTIDLPCTVDFWRLSSCGTDTKSSQSVRELMSPTVRLRDRHVILVDDIVDSGRTLTHALHRLAEHSPLSITVVALLQNEASLVAVDHVGFISGKDFVVGYGLDIAYELRGLPALYYLENSRAQESLAL
ncbi:MAG: hypoxanthine phosphoribosyltransferase [Rhodothermaceae bacterium]|nr:hypoxanthine phosphoribosyltransferase [Rhodothermaceae bacterium]